MTAKPITKITTKGICDFCKSEIDKAKMTQHLKYCKQRVAINATNAENPALQKQHLFHILIEGRYNPEYWMHIETPASESLLTLRVIAEREGVLTEDEESEEIVIARNIAPVIICKECGKPAKKVAMGGYYGVVENAYCNKCAKKNGEYAYEEMLPIVNSPRVGVCGYTGDD